MEAFRQIIAAFAAFAGGVGIGGLVVWLAIRRGYARSWTALEGDRLTKEIGWGAMVLTGLAAGILVCAIESYLAGHLLGWCRLGELMVGQILGVLLFGTLGGLLWRRASLGGLGQLYGALVGVITAGPLLAEGLFSLAGCTGV